MPPVCPHCDPPEISLLRLVLMGAILRAEEPLLVQLADLIQTYGLLPPAAEPAAYALAGRSTRSGQGRRARLGHRTARSRPPRRQGVHQEP